MGGAISTVFVFFKLVLTILNIKTTRNKQIKVFKEKALKEVQRAIQTGDDSQLTAGFSKLKRLR